MSNIFEKEPGEGVRAPKDPDAQRETREDHRQTTDAPRWGQRGESVRERGYPREGGEPPAERERRVANPGRPPDERK